MQYPCARTRAAYALARAESAGARPQVSEHPEYPQSTWARARSTARFSPARLRTAEPQPASAHPRATFPPLPSAAAGRARRTVGEPFRAVSLTGVVGVLLAGASVGVLLAGAGVGVLLVGARVGVLFVGGADGPGVVGADVVGADVGPGGV